MIRRRVIVIPALVGVVLLLILGGLLYLNSRESGNEPDVAVHEPGPDGPPHSLDERRTAEQIEPLLGEEYLRAVETALRVQLAEEEARRAAEAYAAARAAGEKVAADAIQRWGRGQLLLAMPSIGVTAAVSQMGYERDGRTPSTPNTPWGVGWYTFTDFPGTPGNAVFSGHVDWYTGAPAVFGRLRNVGMGDAIYMVLADGTPIAYTVERYEWVTPYTADVGEIFGITEREAITFITCGGAWDPVAKDYSHRLIVRAYRAW